MIMHCGLENKYEDFIADNAAKWFLFLGENQPKKYS